MEPRFANCRQIQMFLGRCCWTGDEAATGLDLDRQHYRGMMTNSYCNLTINYLSAKRLISTFILFSLFCKDRRRVELKNKYGAVSMEVSQLVCVCVYVGQCCNAAVRQAGRVAGQPASQSSPIARSQSVTQCNALYNRVYLYIQTTRVKHWLN